MNLSNFVASKAVLLVLQRNLIHKGMKYISHFIWCSEVNRIKIYLKITVALVLGAFKSQCMSQGTVFSCF